MEKLTNIIESLLFVSGKEVALIDIADKLDVSKNEVKLAVLELQKKYSGDCGILLMLFNDKVQFGSNPAYGEEVSSVLNPIRERELSRSMLETAAIIAYKQPVTRSEIEELRGNSDYAIQNLLKLGVIDVVGKKDAIGHPYLFGTTDKFLKRFRIPSLEDLPDYDELMERVKILNAGADDNYLYRKDVYVDDGTEEELAPLKQFTPKPKDEPAVTSDTELSDIKDEKVPDFLKDEDVELYEADDEDDDDETDSDDYFEEENGDDEDDEDFEEFSMDDEDTEFEDEEEDDSDYEDEEEEQEDYPDDED